MFFKFLDSLGSDLKFSINYQSVCTEAGMLALRERRMRVIHQDFKTAKEKALYKKNSGAPEGLYL